MMNIPKYENSVTLKYGVVNLFGDVYIATTVTIPCKDKACVDLVKSNLSTNRIYTGDELEKQLYLAITIGSCDVATGSKNKKFLGENTNIRSDMNYKIFDVDPNRHMDIWDYDKSLLKLDEGLSL